MDKLAKYTNERRAMLENPDVAQSLSRTEYALCKAGTNTSILNLPDKELISSLTDVIRFTCRDIGIKSEPDRYDATRFFSIVKTYYSDLTVSEIKLAFELSLVGKLDEWLPKNRDGVADRNHYQSFSTEYVTKILTAYRNYKGEVWNKATKLLPPPTTVVTEAEKEAIRSEFHQAVIACFDNYAATGVVSCIIPFLICDELVRFGIIEEEKEPRKQAIETVLSRIKLDTLRINKYDRFAIIGEAAAGQVHPVLNVNAKVETDVLRIRDGFDKVIFSGKTMRDYYEV